MDSSSLKRKLIMKKRIFFIISLFFVVVGLVMTCFIVYVENNRGIPMNAVFYLTPKQITQYTRLAETGDADAAYKIYEYYEYYLLDQESAFFWLNNAAGLGSKKAKNDLLSCQECFKLTPEKVTRYTRLAETGDADAAFALFQYYTYSINDQASSFIWLNKSADLGSEPAKMVLKLRREKTIKH